MHTKSEDKCRKFIEAVVWMARSAAQWHLLPSECGNWNTVYCRVSHWSDKGIWQRMFDRFANNDGARLYTGEPPPRNRTRVNECDEHLYGERHFGGALISVVKQYRRVFTRYDKLAQRYLGFIQVVSSFIWLR